MKGEPSNGDKYEKQGGRGQARVASMDEVMVEAKVRGNPVVTNNPRAISNAIIAQHSVIRNLSVGASKRMIKTK